MMETSVIQGCLIALVAFSAWFLGVSFEKIKTKMIHFLANLDILVKHLLL